MMGRMDPGDATAGAGKTDSKESDWLCAIAAGDARSFEALYRHLYPRLFRFVLRVVGRLDLVEDVLSETMLTVWHSASGFRHASRPSTWIFGIAYRKALQALRAQGVDPLQPAPESVDPVSVEKLVDRAALQEVVRCAVAALPADQRAALELTFFCGHSCEEVAAILDCPVGTVKSRMFLARARLRPLLVRLQEESR
jgi:RNA polymerase sigma-70 factor (ECF subfamily)